MDLNKLIAWSHHQIKCIPKTCSVYVFTAVFPLIFPQYLKRPSKYTQPSHSDKFPFLFHKLNLKKSKAIISQYRDHYLLSGHTVVQVQSTCLVDSSVDIVSNVKLLCCHPIYNCRLSVKNMTLKQIFAPWKIHPTANLWGSELEIHFFISFSVFAGF